MASGGRTYRRRRLPSLSPVTSLGRAVGMTFFVITIFPKASVPIDDSPQEENAYFERYDRAYALSRGGSGRVQRQIGGTFLSVSVQTAGKLTIRRNLYGAHQNL